LIEQTFNITSDYGNVIGVNQQIREYLSGENLEEHLCNAVEICLTEALNNVIKHSYSGDNTKSIEINIKKDSKFLEIEIVDAGSPRKNLTIKELDFDPEDIDNLPESGMGLFIIKQLMDELDYNSKEGKNYFILKKWLI
jgi:serine/threonine-protein kinase RsbW